MKFAVLHNGEDCWTITEGTGADSKEVPWRFESVAEAELELKEYLADQHQAVDSGDMDYKYQREEFTIVPVEE